VAAAALTSVAAAALTSVAALVMAAEAAAAAVEGAAVVEAPLGVVAAAAVAACGSTGDAEAAWCVQEMQWARGRGAHRRLSTRHRADRP
jgi:hypothetical protein